MQKIKRIIIFALFMLVAFVVAIDGVQINVSAISFDNYFEDGGSVLYEERNSLTDAGDLDSLVEELRGMIQESSPTAPEPNPIN